jgi:glycosyltransferase involved in cell wall biosynthesis
MISVCIATYNGEKYIKEQLDSILSQLGENDEVLVSDDSSQDATLVVIEKIMDKRIKVFKLNSADNSGGSGVFEKMKRIRLNFANALQHAKGDVIFLSDQDDVWKENKVNRMLELLKLSDCVVHDCTVVDNAMNVLFDSYLAYRNPRHSLIGTFIKPPFMGCCMAFNRKVLERALPFSTRPIEHDTWIGLCAFKIGKVSIVNDNLLYYRRHSFNVSPSVGKNIK